ncbi:exosortase-dependent surface protein XDP2 [Cronbergia sp. UHCC 0137]|uniref:exosortase-dependent surface protein XDP2 n=1 Tax=Cronbergia sp. UHCC 0137 TaxID=3110239 RepID=UPI002B205498|nr:exosortase-dependent surface protein XDP2 [Cronbergia sp. UHCC 0137]MEA5620701.1 exosortase-dependent surface protein XDP2 [Cronbergia sp. UHCC 0137]
MNLRNLSAILLASFGTVLAFSPAAKAANFTSTIQGTDPKGNIFLQSITQNNTTFSNFNFVTSATILENDAWTGGNSGAASTDRGDNASSPFATQENLVASNASDGAKVAAFLGNNNLNNIIDTEDTGKFKMNVNFASAITADSTGLDNLFFFERGKNSQLKIQALNATGSLIGNAMTLNSANFGDAGYSIDTLEIGGSQTVGSFGVSLASLGVNSLYGLQLISESNFNGPDFKVIARQSVVAPQEIPEPGNIAALALLTVGALGLLKKKSLVQV